jgi:hypothetical protein
MSARESERENTKGGEEERGKNETRKKQRTKDSTVAQNAKNAFGTTKEKHKRKGRNKVDRKDQLNAERSAVGHKIPCCLAPLGTVQFVDALERAQRNFRTKRNGEWKKQSRHMHTEAGLIETRKTLGLTLMVL